MGKEQILELAKVPNNYGLDDLFGISDALLSYLVGAGGIDEPTGILIRKRIESDYNLVINDIKIARTRLQQHDRVLLKLNQMK